MNEVKKSSNVKLTYQEVYKRFDEQGCVLLDDTYINTKTKMRFMCSCGKEDKKTYNAFKESPLCRICVSEKRKLVNKNPKPRNQYTIDDVRTIFKEAGCVLLDNEYKAYSTKMKYICKCGEESEISLGKLLGGRSCKECANQRRASVMLIPYETVLKDFEMENYKLLTSEKDYIDSSQKVKFKCPSEHVGEMTYSGFRGGSRCLECSGFKRLEYEDVFNYFETNGCILLDDKYINSHTKMKYICSCGNKSEINYNNFSNGKRCNKCADEKRAESRKVPYDVVKSYFLEYGSELISKEYEKQTTILTYVCKCGEKARSSYSTFKVTKRCRACLTNDYKNGNLTEKERFDMRLITGYTDWVRNCYQRDDYTCQCCFEKGGKLNAHHKDSYHWCEDRRLDDSNSVTLCENCHVSGEYAFHKVYGNKNNTEIQFNEWLDKYQSKILSERRIS